MGTIKYSEGQAFFVTRMFGREFSFGLSFGPDFPDFPHNTPTEGPAESGYGSARSVVYQNGSPVGWFYNTEPSEG